MAEPERKDGSWMVAVQNGIYGFQGPEVIKDATEKGFIYVKLDRVEVIENSFRGFTPGARNARVKINLDTIATI